MGRSRSSVTVREYGCLYDAQAFRGVSMPLDFGVKMEQPAYREMRDFVLTSATGDDASQVMRISTRCGMEVLEARNYVGVITTRSGTTVEILPKIAGNDLSDQEVRRIFCRMLAALRGGLFKNLGRAELKVARMPLFDIFVAMYVAEAERLARRGFRSGYASYDSNERFLRGRLLVAEDARRNSVDKSRVFVRHAVYGLDRPENRLVRSTLELLLDRVSSVEIRRRIKLLLDALSSVPPASDVVSDVRSCSRDRNMASYRQLIEWSRIFLEGRAFTSFRGPTVSEALLFPMNRVFEDYIAHLVRKALLARCPHGDGGGWSVSTQDHGTYLFGQDSAKCYPLRPDIVLRCRGKRPVVLDTKWKLLGGANDKPSIGDMYQMFAYAKRYGAVRVVLVYPYAGGSRCGWAPGGELHWLVEGPDPQCEVACFFADLGSDNPLCGLLDGLGM